MQSIYFGGGTPSLFSADQIADFLSAVRARLDLRPDVEITLEANPGTIERDSFPPMPRRASTGFPWVCRALTTNCLSDWPYSWPAEIEQSLQSLKSAGISNFNIDLMYALPGQSPAQSRRDIELAIEAGPAHISFYQLTIEPNTAFAAQPPRCRMTMAWDMQQAGLEMLEASITGNMKSPPLPNRISRAVTI